MSNLERQLIEIQGYQAVRNNEPYSKTQKGLFKIVNNNFQILTDVLKYTDNLYLLKNEDNRDIILILSKNSKFIVYELR